ncbi:MAG TPA: hypothetical protein VE057_26590 [Archangium sp.]|nr:hypothetical protein [Archangium sp.]
MPKTTQEHRAWEPASDEGSKLLMPLLALLVMPARLWPVLSGTETWFWLVGSAGLVTLLPGAWVALFQRERFS